MATEKDFESAIAKYPEMIEEGLVLVGRQSVVGGKRMDLHFEDRLKNNLVVELKWKAITFADIGQVMYYAGCLISGKPVREMLVGTRVPPNVQAIFDYHGIEWKEITISDLRDFLRAKGDVELARVFEATVAAPAHEQSRDLGVEVHADDRERPSALRGPAALFAPIEGKWIDAAFDYFRKGNGLLYFVTGASIGEAAELGIRYVYFKRKGETQVTARGDLVRVTRDHQSVNRLPGAADIHEKFSYGFRNLIAIEPIPLSGLRYYSTDRALRNDVPGARIIKDPTALESKT